LVREVTCNAHDRVAAAAVVVAAAAAAAAAVDVAAAVVVAAVAAVAAAAAAAVLFAAVVHPAAAADPDLHAAADPALLFPRFPPHSPHLFGAGWRPPPLPCASGGPGLKGGGADVAD